MYKVLQSPSHNHKERLMKLSEKISEVRIYTEHEKTNRLKSIEQALEFIEDNVFECQEAFTKALKGLEDNIGNLQQEIDEDTREADAMVSNDLQELLKFEQKLQSTYENICQRRKEHESHISELLTESASELSADIQAEAGQMQDSVKQLTQIYQSDIKNLRSALTQVKSDREGGDEKIENYMRTNLTKLSDDVSEIQKASEFSEKSFFNAIKSSVVDVKATIDTEKKTRETSHEHMIKLLEDSYKSFNSHYEF